MEQQRSNIHPAINNYLNQVADYATRLLGTPQEQINNQVLGNTLNSLEAHLTAGEALSGVLQI